MEYLLRSLPIPIQMEHNLVFFDIHQSFSRFIGVKPSRFSICWNKLLLRADILSASFFQTDLFLSTKSHSYSLYRFHRVLATKIEGDLFPKF